jgi:hypothetical protein
MSEELLLDRTVREMINDIDRLRKQVVAAREILDGYSAYDFVGMTGIPLERCQELYDLLWNE